MAIGKEVVKELAERLTAEFGKGFSASNLAYMRTFFLLYQDRAAILQAPSGKSAPGPIVQTPSVQYAIAQARPGQLLAPSPGSTKPIHLELVALRLPARHQEPRRTQLLRDQGANIHAREYQLYLPGKEELRQKLIEWTSQQGTGDAWGEERGSHAET